MSMDPSIIQSLLLQAFQQPVQAGTQGGGPGGGQGPAMQGSVSPMNAAANLAQKAMLIRALQAPARQQAQANAMLPGTQAQIAQDPTMQALQQPPQMQPMDMGMPPIAAPNSQPTPGWS